jgi:hypothetical protein
MTSATNDSIYLSERFFGELEELFDIVLVGDVTFKENSVCLSLDLLSLGFTSPSNNNFGS